MSDTAHEKLADESQGKCLYCAYDLTGIPDDANCPECGRQNIPTAFRREVQDIFDSPLRLYREAFRIIGKHPPGWYWSLDRPGDVARSFRLAILNIVLCFVILGGAWIAANAYVVRVTEDTYYVLTGTTAPVHAYVDIVDVGPFGAFTEFLSKNYLDENQLQNAILVRTKTSVTRERRFRGFTVESFEPLISPAMLLTAIWMTITQLGMWTQIRRGLPAYARARQTIMAAGNCESCRLPVQALLIALVLAIETAIRLTLMESRAYAMTRFSGVLIPSMVIVVLAFWIGPLRSDFTHQLIRSRLHAVRMFIMYVLLFPGPVAGILAALISLIALGHV